MTGNGSTVIRAELEAHLKGIDHRFDSLNEKVDLLNTNIQLIFDDISALRSHMDKTVGASEEKSHWLDSRRFIVGAAISGVVGLTTSVVSLLLN
jgi:hypothetical protein